MGVKTTLTSEESGGWGVRSRHTGAGHRGWGGNHGAKGGFNRRDCAERSSMEPERVPVAARGCAFRARTRRRSIPINTRSNALISVGLRGSALAANVCGLVEVAEHDAGNTG